MGDEISLQRRASRCSSILEVPAQPSKLHYLAVRTLASHLLVGIRTKGRDPIE
jgi:hypothetical protein